MNKILKVLIIFILFFLFTQNVFANDFELEINPSIIQFDAIPQKTIETKIKLKNPGKNQQELKIILREVDANTGKNGRITFPAGKAAEETETILRENINIFDENGIKIQDVTLLPNQEKNLTIGIKPESYNLTKDLNFAVIFIDKGRTAAVSAGNSLTKISGGVGVLILIRTDKNFKPAIIDQFSAPVFVREGPVNFNLLLNNKDSHLERVSGTIDISNMFGQTIGKIELPTQIVLANSKKYLYGSISGQNRNDAEANSIPWGNKNLFGIYSARLNLSLNENKSLTRTIYFTALPPFPLASSILFMLFLIGIYLRVKNKLKK